MHVSEWEEGSEDEKTANLDELAPLAIVEQVIPDSSAGQLGLMAGDLILQLHVFGEFSHMELDEMLTMLETNQPSAIEVIVRRNKRHHQFTVEPDWHMSPALGFALKPE